MWIVAIIKPALDLVHIDALYNEDWMFVIIEVDIFTIVNADVFRSSIDGLLIAANK